MIRHYKHIKDVIQDFKFRYRSHRALKDVVGTMAEGLDIFKSTEPGLEEDCEGLRLELHLFWGGHVFHTHSCTKLELETLAEVKANAAEVHFVSHPVPINGEEDGEVAFADLSSKKKNTRRRGKKASLKSVVVDKDSATPSNHPHRPLGHRFEQ